MVEKITVSLPEDTYERLHEHLDYGDNRSQLIAEAIDEYLDRVEAEEGNLNLAATTD